MAYTTINKSTAHFNTKLYTGNGSNGYSISGVGHQPDLVWIKSRSAGSTEHHLMDVLQGWGTGSSDTPNISSNNTSAAYSRNIFSSNNVNADGFELNDYSDTNTNSQTHVAWNWKANGTGSANTDGDINSTVSVNTTAGFSIVKYTGNASSNQSIGHGLGVRPKMIIIKNLDTVGAWMVWHDSLTSGSGTQKFLQLDNTNAQNNGSAGDFPDEPTTSVFKVGSYDTMNKSGDDIIAYCFADIDGFSKMGSYSGNGNADGPFIYTGFKPAFLMIKGYAGADSWIMYDNKRSGYNSENEYLDANNTDAEEDGTGKIDFLSNGFKIKSTFSSLNYSTGEYIYMAFAESPFVNSNGIPTNAK